MSAPIPIKLKITNAGRLAALDALNSGLNLKLTQIAIGSGKYNSETTGATHTALQAETGRYSVSGGSIEPVSRTLRFSAILESSITQNAFEVGLFDEHGVLFAVASTTSNDPLILVTANIAFVASFSLLLSDVNVTNLTVVDDPSSPLAIALMNQHVANPDPHPQYPLKTALANAIWHVGSWHGTNSTSYNPATALAPFFGYETTWYLWPYVPAGVANTSAALGQFITFQNGSGTQAATTRIWQRLPDGASPPSYSLTASQTTVDEGEQITFTLNTTGLAQGTAVDWLILPIPYNGINASDISPSNMSGSFIVGADGSATHTITIAADEATEGTEILQFLLAAFPEKSVSITINDSSVQLEQIVTISSNATGLNLRSEFNMRYGQPTSATKAVFIIESGVEIIADAVNARAIYGDFWPEGSTREVRILNNAKVIGGGGKGGTGGSRVNQNIEGNVVNVEPTNGENGGTAIEAANDCPIIVKNYGLVAGGGGGGGGGGLNSTYLSGSGGGGGGFGLRGDAGNTKYYDSTWQSQFPEFVETTNGFKLTGGIGGSGSHTSTAYTVDNFGGKGGNGGDVGENGSNGQDGQEGVGNPIAGKSGGLAGYIYQGSVTINNLSGGETKGRTP